ncbi:MAG: hypothetical protein FJ279_04135 [Planctomycetes bacterium]|nr:hypothetical protein [Planctomycetota bacterium]MBM4078693.1 hypothetical protein [Planctomycetota bacterium]
MWVFSDESRNSLRMRFVDAQGQTLQPTSDPLTWKGRRWIEFKISDPKGAGHWCGPNDGVIRWPVRLDCPLLVDSPKRKTSGTVHFAGTAWVY